MVSPVTAPGSGERRWRHFDRSYVLWALLIAILLVLVINPLEPLSRVRFGQEARERGLSKGFYSFVNQDDLG